MKYEVDRFNTFCAMLLTDGHTDAHKHTHTHKVIAINPWRGLISAGQLMMFYHAQLHINKLCSCELRLALFLLIDTYIYTLNHINCMGTRKNI